MLIVHKGGIYMFIDCTYGWYIHVYWLCIWGSIYMYVDCVYGWYIHAYWLCIWVVYTCILIVYMGGIYMYIDCVYEVVYTCILIVYIGWYIQVCPTPEPWFTTPYITVFFVFNCLRWEMIVCVMIFEFLFLSA
jgi:hypothetical protein